MPGRKSTHTPEYAIFLRTLREVRKEADLRQSDMAKGIGQSQSFVSKCERGERRIDIIELRDMCGVAGMRLEAFASLLDSRLRRSRAIKKSKN